MATAASLAILGALAGGLLGALWGSLFALLNGSSGRVMLAFAVWGVLAGAAVGGLSEAFAWWAAGGPADEAGRPEEVPPADGPPDLRIGRPGHSD
jgi:hypothetical protein